MTKHLRASLLSVALVALMVAGMDVEARRILPRKITLADPVTGAVIPQNDLATGCALNATYGYGYMIAFDWSTARAVPNGTTFTLVLQHTGAPFPALTQEGLTDPSYLLVECNTFVIDSNLSSWYWQVSVFGADGRVRAVSEQRPLSFAPCRLSGGQACNAP
jgi:hypothetical protein